MRGHPVILSKVSSRRWLGAIFACLLVAGLGLDAVADTPSPIEGHLVGPQPNGLPYVLRPGDVLVNSALGVLRTPARDPIARLFVSPALGVERTLAPIEATPAPFVSPVLGVLRGSAIFGLNPDVLAVGQNAQTLRINGHGLGAVQSLVLDPPADATIVSFTIGASGEYIDAIVDVASQATPGLRRLRAIDAQGKPVADATPGASRVLFAADQPQIASVSPNFVARDGVYTLEIRGSNLRGLPLLDRPQFNEQPVVTITPLTGVAVGGEPQSNAAGTLVSVSIAVDADAPLTDRLIQVVTSSGVSSDILSPSNTLHLSDATLHQFSLFVSPQLGVTRSVPSAPANHYLASAVVGVSKGPSIQLLSPTFASPGESIRLILAGQGLAEATAIELDPAQGIEIDAATLSISATEVSVDVHIAADAQLVPRRVSLITPTLKVRAPELLVLRDAPPQLTALTPSWLLRDGSSQTIELQGEHLGQVTAVSVTPDTNLIIEGLVVVSDNLARLSLRTSGTAELGPRVVKLMSPSGDSSGNPSPSNSLYIVDRSQVLTSFVSPVLGVLKQVPGAAVPDVFLTAPALGVVRGPLATSVSPSRLPRGSTTRVTISGLRLDAVDSVALSPADGLALGNVTIADDGLSVAFNLDVAVDASVGVRRAELVAGSARIPFAPAESALIEISDNIVVGPIAEPDTYAVTTNLPLAVDATNGVLVNDHDPNGGTLYAVLRRLTAHGTIALSADGSFIYSPQENFVGTDRFEYSAGSGALVGASTVVTLNVAQTNRAVDDCYITNDNQVLNVTAALGLLSNDVIGAGETVSIELTSQPTLGQIAIDPNGGFVYQPSGASGVDQFGYRLISAGVASVPAVVRITVNDLNEAPVALDDHYVVDRGHVLTVSAPGVLGNDVDPDHDVLSARIISSPLIGAVTLNTNGSFTYTPPVDFSGQTEFRYEASDPRGLRAQATVFINVNDHLAPLPDAYSLDEGEVLFVDAPGVLANDSIIPQGALRVVVVQAPTLGTVQMANDGSFVYRTTSPESSGQDLFRYRLEDASIASYPVDVKLTIRAVNDPPQSVDDRYLTDENVELEVNSPGVLANDTDIDSSQLSARLLGAPAHGAIVLRADGSFSYVPEVNYRGNDTFTYETVDDSGAASSGSVIVAVTQPPTATNDVYLVDVDTPLEVVDPKDGLLANDHDAPEDDELTVIPGAPPAHGSLELNEDGTFRFVPDTGYVGIDTFTYQVTDGLSSSNFGNVTLAIGITSLPRANPDAYDMNEDEQLLVDAEHGVLANDTDADTPHENLQVFLVDYDYWNVRVTLAADGSFTARAGANFYGETFFIYQIYDGTSVSNAVRVTLTVNPVNDGVEANDDLYGVLRNTVFDSDSARSIKYNDHYDSDYPVNFEIVQSAQFGSVELDQQSGHFRYTPQQDFSGVDTFVYHVYQVSTGIGDTATVTLRTNGPPTTNPDFYTVNEDSVEVVTPTPIANDSDPDGDPLQYTHTGFYSGNYYVYLGLSNLLPTATASITGQYHFYGTQTFRYEISDGTQRTYGDVTVTVLPVPDAPIVAADNYITPRNTELVVSSTAKSVLYNDFDPDTRPYPNGPVWAAATGLDLLPISAQLVTPPSHGNLVFSPIGTFTYMPNTDYSGIDEFTYRALDATGRQSELATVRIRVNTPPTATDDVYIVNEDVVLAVAASEGLLGNDADIDGDRLSASFAQSGCAPCNGRVEVRGDGSFRYTPNANYYGQDEFFYTVGDGIAGTDVGRVGITILPVNDAPYTEPDTYRTREDEVLVAPEPQGILRNDREVDGERLINAELIEPPQRGEVVVMPDGAFTYTPAVNVNGRDTFTYRVYDESGLFSDDTVEILVTPVNDPPIVADDNYETPQNAILEVATGQGVLANDIDVDGPNPTAVLIGLPQHGQVDLLPDGSFVYTPDGIFSGIDQFQYQVDDGLGAIAAAVANIVVRPVDPDVIIVVEDDLYGFEGPIVTISAPGVLANDRVTGAPALTAALVVAPETGSVNLDADGGFHYLAPAGFVGQVGFTYSASAGGVSELGRVTLDVRSTANVPPVAVGEQFGVLEDHVLDSHSSGSLLANDSDYEGASLTLIVDTLPAHGALTASVDGHFTYAPVADFNGTDSIVYRVSDGVKLSEPATATITIFAQNDAPQALPDLYRGARDETLVIDAAHGLLANDSDVDGDSLNVELVDAPGHGQVQVQVNGSFQYQPAPAFVGTDHFRYAATDAVARDVAEVSLTITAGTNHAPVASGESFAIDEDAILSSADVGELSANDVDPDGDPLAVNLVAGPARGVLDLDGGHFSYHPEANFFGYDSFRYTVTDGELTSEIVVAEILVRPVNDAPLALTDRYTATQNQTLHVSVLDGVLGNDSDIESQPLSALVHAGTSHGLLDLHADGSFNYLADAAFVGRDEFSYEVSDGDAISIGRAIIDVTASGNQRPLAIGEVFAIAEDSVLDTRSLESLLANDRDPEGQPLSLMILAQPATGTLETFAEGHIRYVPKRNAVGDVTIPYVVSDGELESLPVDVRITLLPIDDPPEAQPDLYLVPEIASVLTVTATDGVLANDVEPDGETLVSELIRAPEYGQLNLGLDGSFVYSLTAARPLHDSFRYRVRDPGNSAAEAEVDLDFADPAVVDTLFKNGFESP